MEGKNQDLYVKRPIKCEKQREEEKKRNFTLHWVCSELRVFLEYEYDDDDDKYTAENSCREIAIHKKYKKRDGTMSNGNK